MAVRAGRVYSSYLAHVVEGGVRCAAQHTTLRLAPYLFRLSTDPCLRDDTSGRRRPHGHRLRARPARPSSPHTAHPHISSTASDYPPSRLPLPSTRLPGTKTFGNDHELTFLIHHKISKDKIGDDRVRSSPSRSSWQSWFMPQIYSGISRIDSD